MECGILNVELGRWKEVSHRENKVVNDPADYGGNEYDYEDAQWLRLKDLQFVATPVQKGRQCCYYYIDIPVLTHDD